MEEVTVIDESIMLTNRHKRINNNDVVPFNDDVFYFEINNETPN